jgi:hypothetical protein
MKVDLRGLNFTKDVQGKLKVFDFPAMPVEISIEVPIPDKKLDPLLAQKLQDAAKKKYDEIQKLFTDEITKKDAKVFAEASKAPGSVDLNGEIKDANATAKGIFDALPAHIKTACEKAYADLQKAHKDLIKYNLKCAVKITWSAAKLGVAAARLGVSHGTDISAWISAAQNIYALAAVVYELAKSADSAQKDVGKEYTALVEAVAKTRKETNNVLQAAKQVAQVEPKIKKVEEKINVLSPKVTNMDEKAHGLAKEVNKMLSTAQSVKAKLKPEAKGKEAELEKKIDATIKKIIASEEKVAELKKYIAAIEVTLDAFRKDYTKGTATTVKVIDVLAKAKELYDQAKDIVDTVKDVVELAA